MRLVFKERLLHYLLYNYYTINLFYCLLLNPLCCISTTLRSLLLGRITYYDYIIQLMELCVDSCINIHMAYKLTYQQIRYQVWQIHLHLPYTREEIITALEPQPWAVMPGSPDTWKDLRLHLTPPYNNPILNDIHQNLSSLEHRANLVNYLYDTVPMLQNRWGMDRETMTQRTSSHCSFMCDKPGFYQPIHTDYRLLVATGMVFLCASDDPRLSTSFYDDSSGNNPIRITTDFCDGWWHVNDGESWHGGHNTTDQDRYSMMIGLTLTWPKK